jgi:hypothetical protein
MKISEQKQFVKKLATELEKTGRHTPTMIWSGPGIGKSSAIRQVADEMGIGFKDLRLALLNPVDLRGLPMVDKETSTAKWLSPEYLPNAERDGERGILFLDEINLAPAAVMNAGYQLILDRRVGEYTLPKGWVVVAAGNRAKDRASVTKFPAPLANRFVHIEIEADVDDWKRWAMNHMEPQIVAFISKFPQHLYKAPETLPAGENSFPTPRSWSYANNLFVAGESIAPAVGQGIGAEFQAYLAVWQSLPDVDAILRGEDVPVPKELDVLWALTTALVSKAEPAQVPAILRYMDSGKNPMPAEFQAKTILALSDKSEDHHISLVNSPEWETWRKNHKDILEEEPELDTATS